MAPNSLREQARRCRRLANEIIDDKAQEALRALAAEYEERAVAAEPEALAAEGRDGATRGSAGRRPTDSVSTASVARQDRAL